MFKTSVCLSQTGTFPVEEVLLWSDSQSVSLILNIFLNSLSVYTVKNTERCCLGTGVPKKIKIYIIPRTSISQISVQN